MHAIVAEKLIAISELIRLSKQYGTLLVLWPTLWSLFIASGGRPSARHLVVFIFGSFLMRSAGCAINDIADRNFDAHVERTRLRPVASGRLTVREALTVFAALSLLAFVLVLFLNTITILLSFFGIQLAVIYPFVKRFSSLPQAFLGIAFGWGAIMAWGAVKNGLDAAPVLIFIANIFWSIAYDTIYAMQDIEDDIKIGVKSTAILFGRFVHFALPLLYLAMAAFLALAGISAGLGVIYFIGIAFCLLLFLCAAFLLKRNPDETTAFNGFFANAVFGGIMLLFIIIDLNV